MNPRYKDNMFALLPPLERGRPLSLKQLTQLCAETVPVTDRTLQRYLKEFREVYGLDLSGARRGLVALPAHGYREGLTRFLKVYFSERGYPPVHGAVSQKSIAAALENHARPATVLCEILKAIRESRRLNFAYKPQHPATRDKLTAKTRRGPITREGFMAVSMIPRGFSFGGELMLVAGEAIFTDGRRLHRQYALRGMLNPQCGFPENVQLEFNFSKVYADSVYTWLGGARYDLTIEDGRFDDEPQTYTLRANGEEEPLQFAEAGLGRVKIVDPPPALVAKAKELGLDTARLFRFSA